MKFLIILACAALAVALPARDGSKLKTKKHIIEIDGLQYDIRPGPELASGHYLPQYVDAEPSPSHGHVDHAVGHSHAPRTGYSVGGSLVSIAQGAADQAHTQLSSQHAAAGQAAYMAKNQLAQSAAQSAATAAAALAGKQIIVLGLEQQSRDAHVAVDGEKMQLQQAQRAATAAQNAARQALHQVQVITAALNAAQATSDHANQAAAEAAAELAAQTTMVGQAKARAQAIDEQLVAARTDFEATQAAANKAAAAAQTAQNNAAAAAAHAASAAAANAPPPPEPVAPVEPVSHKSEALFEVDPSALQAHYGPPPHAASAEAIEEDVYDYKGYHY